MFHAHLPILQALAAANSPINPNPVIARLQKWLIPHLEECSSLLKRMLQVTESYHKVKRLAQVILLSLPFYFVFAVLKSV